MLAISSVFALSACGGSSSSTPTPTPTPINSAPTDITIDNASVSEREAGAVVGNLEATDSDSGDSHTFSVDGDLFVVDGKVLKLSEEVEVNYEADQTHTVSVTATDSQGSTFTKELTIDVTDVLDTYTFASAYDDGSSVSYSGQIARHALINELNYFISNEFDENNPDSEYNKGVFVTKQDVLEHLNKYFRTTEEQYDNFELMSFGDNAKQKFISDISSGWKRLGGASGKIAGRDETGQHKTWGHTDAPASTFVGWGEQGEYTPESLVDYYFDQLADNVMTQVTGAKRYDPKGSVITKVYVNEDGTDLKQLIQKFLLMAVTYSQSTDDYFGHETEGKGLTTDNTQAKSGKNYTNLEHQFDEGYGYFGAARDYREYNDNEISGKVSSDEDGRSDWNGKHDTDGDGEIDLNSEYNFGASVNAAKRDRGSSGNANPTNFTKDAMTALIAGRALINENVGNALTDEQMETLKGHRDQAVLAWEKAIAATVVHYINDSNADLTNLLEDSEDFSFSDLAKHWSELKGFALGLQFNPYSPLSDEKFAQFHQLVGDKPEMETSEIAAYQQKLIQARDILQEAYSFDAENVTNW